MQHAAQVHRCLMAGDVAGLLRLRAQSHAHPVHLDPAEALIAFHMARVEAKFMPPTLRQYSTDFLRERGYRRIEGRWTCGAEPPAQAVAAAGIASRSSDPRISRRILRAMGDAYLDALAAGIDEPPLQRERMLKARARQRFSLRID